MAVDPLDEGTDWSRIPAVGLVLPVLPIHRVLEWHSAERIVNKILIGYFAFRDPSTPFVTIETTLPSPRLEEDDLWPQVLNRRLGALGVSYRSETTSEGLLVISGKSVQSRQVADEEHFTSAAFVRLRGVRVFVAIVTRGYDLADLKFEPIPDLLAFYDSRWH